MPRTFADRLLLALAIVLATGGCATAQVQHQLGTAPLCEASAALRAPWNQDLILVGDNEVDDWLFGFEIDEQGLLGSQRNLRVPGDRLVDDLEALAAVGDRIVLVGSHGRGGSCVLRPRRQRIQLLRWNAEAGRLEEHSLIDAAAGWSGKVADLRSCMTALFTAPPPTGSAQLCHAIVKAAQTGRKGACTTLDIEGAAATGAAGEARLWLGLRQPRFGDRAVLARLTEGLDELRFDAVVMLDAPRGVRALAVNGPWLWAILGPVAPDFASSCLVRVPAAELISGAILKPEVMAEGLPPNSEGLVFDGNAVIVVTDGEEPSAGGQECQNAAGQLRIDLS